MSDTPSTDDVRMAYGDRFCPSFDDPRHKHACPADEDFDRWLASVKAEALREAEGIVSSQAAEEWRLDRGEGMPGGVSKPGSQLIAMSLDRIASIIINRADQIEEESPDA